MIQKHSKSRWNIVCEELSKKYDWKFDPNELEDFIFDDGHRLYFCENYDEIVTNAVEMYLNFYLIIK